MGYHPRRPLCIYRSGDRRPIGGTGGVFCLRSESSRSAAVFGLQRARSSSPPLKTSRTERGIYGGKTFKTGGAISGHGRGSDLRRLGDRGPRGGEVRDLRSPAGGVRRGDGDGRPRILPLDLRHSLRIGRG